MLKCSPEGPARARYMLVGEAPGKDEEGRTPFRGASGQELTRILGDAGIARSECFITNCTPYRPPDNEIQHFFHDGWTKGGNVGTMRSPKPELQEGIAELEQQIRSVKPNVIIAFGNTPLWALQDRHSAKSGIGDWRGSELALAKRLAGRPDPLGHECVVIPTYHPAAVLRAWDWRSLVVHDLRTRARRYEAGGAPQVPAYRFHIKPSFPHVREHLADLQSRASRGRLRLACDIETGQSLIWCIGIAWSRLDALCIPFRCLENPQGYWGIEEEVAIMLDLQDLLTHPNVEVVGQNFLYDAQYFARYLGFVPRIRDDTMLMQHVAYAGMDKGLDFLSSLYCIFHEFWKNEGKDVGRPKTPMQQDVGWTYNCKDAVITYECADVLDGIIDKRNLRSQYRFQMELWWRCLTMMLRGVRINFDTRKELIGQLMEAGLERQDEINYIVGHPLNTRSSPQMKALLYADLKLPTQYNLKKGRKSVTCDKKALANLARLEPLVRPLLGRIAEFRAIENSKSVVQMGLGPDNRGRSYFNPAGAETFRWSSSEDAFGSGTNYQNLSRGLEDETIDDDEIMQYNLPNVRRLFRPDAGYTIGEADQAGADAWIVAYESGEEKLKQILASGLKLAAESAKMMYGSQAGADGKREPYYTRAKSGGHATNYGARPGALQKALGITRHEAELFQRRWFQIYPNVKEVWHKRIQSELNATRTVYNVFGFRRFYQDRPENLLKEALAWIPQSTVAVCSNFGVVNTAPLHHEQAIWAEQWMDPQIHWIREELFGLGFEMLIQVHDSIVFQYPTASEPLILPLLYRAIHTTVPYESQFCIPWTLKTSTRSWGDAEKAEWPALIEPAQRPALEVLTAVK